MAFHADIGGAELLPSYEVTSQRTPFSIDGCQNIEACNFCNNGTLATLPVPRLVWHLLLACSCIYLACIWYQTPPEPAKMAWLSSGSSNAGLINNLARNGLINSERVKNAMLAVCFRTYSYQTLCRGILLAASCHVSKRHGLGRSSPLLPA